MGCGASYFFTNNFYHLIVVCHYYIRGATSELPRLKRGRHHATDFRVLHEYDILYTAQMQGCPAN